MALPTISISDFIGEIRLNQDQYTAVDLQQLIDAKYPELVRLVLGDWAYLEISESDPMPQKWQDLLDGVAYVDGRGVRRFCDGLVKAVKYLLYPVLLRESNWNNTSAGNFHNYNENSKPLSGGSMSVLGALRNNQGVDFVASVYHFIRENSQISTEFTSQTDNNDNTYTFEVETTKYLAVGDVVQIGGISATVTAIVADTEITADTGLDGLFFAQPIVWHPFQKYEMTLPILNKNSGL